MLAGIIGWIVPGQIGGIAKAWRRGGHRLGIGLIGSFLTG
jgi:hypothetical protein